MNSAPIRGPIRHLKNASPRSRRSAGQPSSYMELLFNEWLEFLKLLTRHRVRFLLIGGHAIAFHAQPRYTEDLDVFVEATAANARRLHAVLVDFGFASAAPEPTLLAMPDKVFMLGRKP